MYALTGVRVEAMLGKRWEGAQRGAEYMFW